MLSILFSKITHLQIQQICLVYCIKSDGRKYKKGQLLKERILRLDVSFKCVDCVLSYLDKQIYFSSSAICQGAGLLDGQK